MRIGIFGKLCILIVIVNYTCQHENVYGDKLVEKRVAEDCGYGIRFCSLLQKVFTTSLEYSNIPLHFSQPV